MTIQIRRSEGIRQEVGKPARTVGMVDQKLVATVLEEHLATPSTRHQWRSVGGHTTECDQPSATTGKQDADHSALRTET